MEVCVKCDTNCHETDANREKKNKRFVTIDDFNANPIRQKVITSPKSVFSMNNLGIEQEDLVYVSFKDFCQSHPETITMNKKEMENRYEFIESIRRGKIEEVIKARNYLIREEQAEEEMRMKTQQLHQKEDALSRSQGNMTTKQTVSNKNRFNNEYNSTKNNYHTTPSSPRNNSEELEVIEGIHQRKIGQIVKDELDRQFLFTSMSKITRTGTSIEKKGKTTASPQVSPPREDQDDYNIRRKKKEIEKEKEIRQKKLQAKQEINDRNLSHNIAKQELKQRQLKKKIDERDVNVIKTKTEQYEEQRRKNEESRMKEIRMEVCIKQMRLIEEREREKKADEINMKQAVFERNKEIAKCNRENNKKAIKELQKKHNNDLIRLRKILHKGINDDTVNQIQQSFCNNEYVLTATNEYFKKKEKTIEENKSTNTAKKETTRNTTLFNNTTQETKKNKDNDDKDKDKEEEDAKEGEKPSKNRSSCNNGDDKDKDKEEIVPYTEEEIAQKVKEFRIETNKEFLNLLSREKANEEYREEQLKQAKTDKQKKELEKQFGKERTMANYRLTIKKE